MAIRTIRIGTRGSALALAQAHWVKQELEEHIPELKVETVVIKTKGDRFLSSPVQAIGGKGIFVKEIEDALLEEKIDLAVHSMKDLPTEIPEGLTIAAVTKREDPRDVLVSRYRMPLKDLPLGSRIGTGSLRRQTQILNHRPDLEVLPIRGNVDTRLKKLDQGEVEALVMAAAGLKRIGQESRICDYLSPEVCLSAVAQGALGLETRADSPVVKELTFLHHGPSATEVSAERAFLRGLGGGCQIPVGARGYAEGQRLRLMGIIGDANGKKILRGEVSGSAKEAERLGQTLAQRLLKDGAEEILKVGGKPLTGRCVMITRPPHQSSSFVLGLEDLGSEVIEFPTIEILPPESYVPLDRTIQNVDEYDWIVFTSVNGVKVFLNRLHHLGRDTTNLKGIRFAAVGPETAKRLSSQGLEVKLVPAEYRAEGILQGLKPEEVRGKRFLLPQAAMARDVLRRILQNSGAEVDVVQTYRTVPARANAGSLRGVLAEKKVDMLTFTSSSTVRNFVDLLPPMDIKTLLNGIAVACIGPVTRKTAEENGLTVDVMAQEYTVPGLIQAIVEYFSKSPIGGQ